MKKECQDQNVPTCTMSAVDKLAPTGSLGAAWACLRGKLLLLLLLLDGVFPFEKYALVQSGMV